MIGEIADFIAEQIESTERYFIDTHFKHVYKFQVSVIRVPLIAELTGKVNKWRDSMEDDKNTLMPPMTKVKKQEIIDKAFVKAGGSKKVIKEAAELGIRRTFINSTIVNSKVNSLGTTKITRADGIEFPRVKQLNKDSLVIQYEAGQILEKRGTGQKEFFEKNPTAKGRAQMIVNRLTNDLLYDARSIAFDDIDAKIVQEIKRGGWGDSATESRNEPAVKGHGELEGNISGTKVQPKSGSTRQTTVAVISMAKNWDKIAGNRKAAFDKTYMQQVLDSHDEVYTRIENQLDLIFEMDRFQDYVTNPEMYEQLSIDLHATDQKGNAAMGSFDVQGIKDTLKNRIAKNVLADITRGWNKKSKKYLDMQGSISKKKAAEKMAKKIIIQKLIKSKIGIKPDLRLKVNKKLVEKGGKLPKKKRGSKTFAVVAKTKKKSITKKGKRGTKGPGVKKGGFKSTQTAKTTQSPIALRNLLNELLPAQVAQNMGSPALNYITGRFANSARVELVNQGPRGGTSIDYTYMKFPYQTFEPGFAQGSTMRDPRKIIGESIRELATGILGRQPHTIRRT